MKRSSALDLVIVSLFSLPAVACVSGGASGAGIAKIVFPAAGAILGAWFAKRDSCRYVRLLLWTIILAPGLRHFTDWYGGFSQSNPIMLASYMIVIASAPTVLVYLLSFRQYSIYFLLIIIPVLIALGTSLLTGALTDPLMAAMRWLTPPWLALYICARACDAPIIREQVLRTFRFAMPLIAIYGIVQFTSILPWDAYYMHEAPINSIGLPQPFQVRVFATMNSPGTLAAMLSTGVLLQLPTLKGGGWMAIPIALTGLLLTSQRAAFGGFVVGLLILATLARGRATRRNLVKIVASIATVCCILLSIPSIALKLTATASSVSQISENQSAQERWKQYESVIPMLDGNKLGRGLGWATNSFFVNVGDDVPLDSGLIDIFVGLGIPGGAIFLYAIAALVFQGFMNCWGDTDGKAASEFAAVMFGVVQLPFGSQHTQEYGMLLYLTLGLLLTRSLRKRFRTGNQTFRDLSMSSVLPL